MTDAIQPDVADDYLLFDGLMQLELHLKVTEPNIDFDSMTLQSSTKVSTVEHCLIRQMSERLSGTVRQIFERGKSIGNDAITLVDTVIEVPVIEAPTMAINSYFIRKEEGIITERWEVIAMDKATLRTRWRVACRSI